MPEREREREEEHESEEVNLMFYPLIITMFSVVLFSGWPWELFN